MTPAQARRAEASWASALGPIMTGERVKHYRHEGQVTGHACPPRQCNGQYGLHRYWVYFDPPGREAAPACNSHGSTNPTPSDHHTT